MKISISQKDFYVYLLIDDLDDTRPQGIFYVGFGKAKRLRSTIAEARKSTDSSNKKVQKIREMWDQGREPRLEIVFSSNNSRKARNCEDFLIKKYGPYLTNKQGVKSKYPQYAFYEGSDSVDEDDMPVLMCLPDPDKLASAIEAAKKIHSDLHSDASEEVAGFLLGLQKQFYPEMVERKPATDLARIARKALMDDGSYLFTHIIARTMTKTEQDRWLEDLAQKVIDLTLQAYKNHGRYPGKKEFRELGYKHIEISDIDMLIIRLRRAGYISKSV